MDLYGEQTGRRLHFDGICEETVTPMSLRMTLNERGQG